MKQVLFLLGLLAGSAAPAAAQLTEVATPGVSNTPAPAPDTTRHPLRWAVGVTAGGVASSFSGSYATSEHDNRYKFGFAAGLSADLRFGERFALHPEVLYARKGSNFTAVSLNRDLRYLDVPVLVRYYLADEPAASTFFVEAGPQVGLLLSARNEAGDDVKSSISRVAGSAVLGAGYRLRNGFSLGLRYDIGVSPVYRELSTADSFGRGDFQPNARHDAFLLLLGYSLSGQN